MRCEGWRRSEAYRLYKSDEQKRDSTRSIKGFDALHQVSRLKKAKNLANGETDLIFETLARNIKSSEQIIEVSSLRIQLKCEISKMVTFFG